MTRRADYSNKDWSYALTLANRGYDPRMIFRALAAKPSGRREPGSMKYQRLLDESGRDRADQYARQTAEKAVAWVADNPAITDRPSALVRLFEIRAVADALPWAVYGGPSERRALEAALGIAEEVGGPSLGIAWRQWSERAGQSMRRLRTHCARLQEMGWVKRNPDDRPGRTARYTIRTPSYTTRTFTYTRGDRNVRGGRGPHTPPREWLSHDAFRPRALGDEGWYLTFAISRWPSDFDELALRTGIGTDPLEDLLARLELADIAEECDGVYHLAGDLLLRLDALAVKEGTAGEGEAERVLHQMEREAFRGRDVNVRTPGSTGGVHVRTAARS